MSVRNAVVLAVLFSMLAGCLGDSQEKGHPAATVNDFTITTEQFRTRLADSAYFSNISALSYEDRLQSIHREIDRELFIQEAMAQGIHKNENFHQAMEKYWAQTLITGLVTAKMKTMPSSELVTQEEVKERYAKLVKLGEVKKTFDQIRGTLEGQIQEEKKAKALEVWVAELRKKADIKVYKDNIRNMR